MVAFGIPLSGLARIARYVRPALIIDANVGKVLEAMTSTIGTEIRKGAQVETLFEESFAKEIIVFASKQDVHRLVRVYYLNTKDEDTQVHCLVVGFICAVVARMKKGLILLDGVEWDRIRRWIEHPESVRQREWSAMQWKIKEKEHRETLMKHRRERDVLIKQVQDVVKGFSAKVDVATVQLLASLSEALSSRVT